MQEHRDEAKRGRLRDNNAAQKMRSFMQMRYGARRRFMWIEYRVKVIR